MLLNSHAFFSYYNSAVMDELSSNTNTSSLSSSSTTSHDVLLRWEEHGRRDEYYLPPPPPRPYDDDHDDDDNDDHDDDDPMMIGLIRLGKQKLEYGDSFPTNVNSSSMSVVGPTKRSRASYQNMQNPCCQVEECNLDLKSAKDYHRRHRICETHSKSPKVIVAGLERRFCQQCSRFHDLSEFDDKKRSCRRRLSDHNARRRRVQPAESSIQLSSAAGYLSSALYDERQQNLPLNGLPISVSNTTCSWENANTISMAFIRPSRSGGGLDGTPSTFSSNEIHKSIFELHMADLDKLSPVHTSNPQRLQIPTTYNNSGIGRPDMMMINAHSLLSSNSWSFSLNDEGESTSNMDHGHGQNYIMNPAVVMRRKSNYSEPQINNLLPFQSFNIPVLEQEQGQGPAAHVTTTNGNMGISHSVNDQATSASHHQEFKAPNI